MARTGRPKKPVALKILQGTFRADRDGDPSHAVIGDGTPEMPKDLTGEAKKLWEQIVPGLVALGIAKAADTLALSQACRMYAEYRRAWKEVVKIPVILPAWSQTIYGANSLWTRIDSILSRFGMTPADRAKLRIEPGKKPTVQARQRNA